MSYTTQCPSCQTRFKVTDKHLSAASGLVRCGRCAHVFNATEHFVSTEAAPPVLTPPAAPANPPAPQVAVAPEAPPSRPQQAAVDPMDDFELELPDFDPHIEASESDSFTLDMAPPEAPAAPAPAPAAVDNSSEAEEFQRALAEALHTRNTTPPSSQSYASALDEPENTRDLPDVFGKQRRRGDQADTPPAPAPVAEPAPAPVAENLRQRPPHPYGDLDEHSPDEEESDTDVPRQRNPLLTTVMVLLSVIGIVLLAGQLIYFNRTRIAAEVPEARPALEAFCHIAACTVPWPSDIAQIRTEWSELAFVPEHANLIQLSATLKNHAAFAQNYPMLEVSLKDADDQVLIRKVFSPKEYLKADDFKLQRFNSNSEVKVTMRLDAGKVRAMGYSLYWFYP